MVEYMYAALLLHKSGKEINEANVKKVLEAAGTKVDDAKVKAVVAALDGVDVDKVIKEASVPMAVPVVEEKKEEKKEKPKEDEKKSEEQAAAGLSSLFG